MGAKNKVIQGDYSGSLIFKFTGGKFLTIDKKKNIYKANVKNYNVIDQSSSKSATSAIARSAVGGALLGPVGLLAGLSAKSKGVYLIAIEFTDGKKSIIEIDDKLYKIFITSMF
ncbi:hypothetical protein [Clostridium sp.]|uniref:hypothetical protein n=1 Tax=Clostridium sp. TaxID=1506 RepID=UPI0028480FF3|nr:hypothetical protein [Clostridium sp.]MDR3594234.1 hypothetical protein [Clostridium sp.]